DYNCAKDAEARGAALRFKRREIIPDRDKVNVLIWLLREVHLLPPLVAILNCIAGVLRDSFLIRARVSQARVKRLCAALNRFSKNMPSVKVIDCFMVLEHRIVRARLDVAQDNRCVLILCW